ncbi:restriction endonuclease subunit S, partial [Campylobacter hyointestinalis]|uniref:restriction endonuclease subunit S n=1 Tax=Campylobacter hyointestinalis TaxID=198 RepID=UPI0005546556
MKWSEFRIGDLFEIKNTFSFNKEKLTNGDEYDYVTRTSLNQGILQSTGFVNKRNLNEAGVWSLGLLQMDFFYRKRQWYAGQFVRKIIPKIKLTQNSVLFFTTLLNCQKKILLSVLVRDVDKTFNNLKIQLPITANGEIDFEFIESFIAELEAERMRELEAYLKAADLADTTLSADEQNALNTLNSKIWQEFKFKDIFNNIKQGRRVKKDDQIDGDIPFIMSGITNTGFVKNISNPIEIYPKNSITIDIFGNTFYRNYVYGAGDDTGIYWNDMKDYSKLVMLFFATSMAKSVYGKFDFGKKLRSSQSLDFTMKLPITTNGEIDFDFMESFISGVQKTSIKGVIELKDKIIEQTKKAI